MPRFRFSIATLLMVVAFSGLGLAALRYASPLLAGLVMGATAVVLLTSILAAILERERSSWLGFAIFGWGYVVLVWGFGVLDAPGRYGPPMVPLTGQLFDMAYPILHATPDYMTNRDYTDPAPGMSFPPGTLAWDSVGRLAFHQTGHAIASLSSGFLGMLIASWLTLRRNPVDGSRHES